MNLTQWIDNSGKINKGLLAFYLLLFLHLFFVWVIPVFVTQDGPAHLYNARILLDIFFEGRDGFYAQYYSFNSMLQPNWFQHIVLSGLLLLFSPIVAEKVFISLYFVSFAFSFKYLIRILFKESAHLLPLIFIIANGFFFLFGFFNFQWGFIFLMIFIGLLLKQKENFSVRRLVVLIFLCAATFFVHPVALIYMLFLIFVDFLLNAFSYKFGSVLSLKEAIKRSISSILIVILPTILFLKYFTHQQGGGYDIFTNNIDLDNLGNLFACFYLKAFLGWENYIIYWFAILIVLILVPYFIYKSNRKITAPRIYIGAIIFLSLFVFFFLVPNMGGGGWLTQRVTIFFYLGLILFAATLRMPKSLKKTTMIMGITISILLLGSRYTKQMKISSYVENYLEISNHIPNNVTVLPLGFSNRGEIDGERISPRLEIFKHISGYIGASGNKLIYDNYEASTAIFPLRWKSECNPYEYLCKGGVGGIEINPPKVDILGYNSIENCGIDYIVMWGDINRFKNSQEVQDIFNQTDKGYTKIQSSEDGLTHLYKRN
jgi:hypothetical protein